MAVMASRRQWLAASREPLFLRGSGWAGMGPLRPAEPDETETSRIICGSLAENIFRRLVGGGSPWTTLGTAPLSTPS